MHVDFFVFTKLPTWGGVRAEQKTRDKVTETMATTCRMIMGMDTIYFRYTIY